MQHTRTAVALAFFNALKTRMLQMNTFYNASLASLIYPYLSFFFHFLLDNDISNSYIHCMCFYLL